MKPREPEPVPSGFERLPEGVSRQVRVNKEFLRYGGSLGDKMAIVEEAGVVRTYSKVTIEGPSELVVTEFAGCGASASVCLQTKASLLVAR